jgi:hypothetical protein
MRAPLIAFVHPKITLAADASLVTAGGGNTPTVGQSAARAGDLTTGCSNK